MRLKWTKDKQSWHVDYWMKVIFNNKSRFCIGQENNDGTNRIGKNDCLKKTSKFPNSFMI